MSIVSNWISEEAEVALRRQRRAATASSIVISLLAVALVIAVLAVILLPTFRIETPPIVTYQAPQPKEEKAARPEVTTQVQRQPSAPSSAMAKVIASTTPSPTAVPVPDVQTPDPSMDFGDGDDFGQGWGSGSGFGGGKGGTSFFGQAVKAERIAYVIDYSASMKSDSREDLMRKELTKSLDQITHGTQYAMIFFAGPAWVAGDEVTMGKGKKGAVVKGRGGHSFKWRSNGTAHGWEHDGKKEPVEWLTASKGQISKSKKIVDETKLVWGTVWDNPLQMALDMEPPPQVIYFMTDGAAKGSDAWARTIGAKAKTRGITINCIAMMEPRAHDDMDDLAKRTKGQFTIVMKGGKRKKVRGAGEVK